MAFRDGWSRGVTDSVTVLEVGGRGGGNGELYMCDT